MKTFLVCSGLGRTRRGFESFAEECFEALSGSGEIEFLLFRGGKARPAERSYWVPSLARKGWAARIMGACFRRDPYAVEQITFGLSLVPHLVKHRPSVILFSDGTLGNVLWRLRGKLGLEYKLLLSNGAPFPPPYPRWDHVQHLTPKHHRLALEQGEAAERHTLLPYGVRPLISGSLPSDSERASIRRRLGLPENRPIVLSIGALNRSHKRMEYVATETARLRERNPYLILLGETETETELVAQIASSAVGPENLRITTVQPEEIVQYCSAADLFALGSLAEGFGRVIVEAMSAGLLCLLHDDEGLRYVGGEESRYGDLRREDELARLMRDSLERPRDGEEARRRSALTRFGWESLTQKYVEMIRRTACPT